MYLLWYDDNPKRATLIKIEEAIAAYVDRFKVRPNVVLVNEVDKAEVAGIAVRVVSYVRRNNFWVGYENASGKAVLPRPAEQAIGTLPASGPVVQASLF